VLASAIAQLGGGVRVKQLRPETTDDILAWMGTDSLDAVESMMVLEEEIGLEIPDSVAERSATVSFRELVLLMPRAE